MFDRYISIIDRKMSKTNECLINRFTSIVWKNSIVRQISILKIVMVAQQRACRLLRGQHGRIKVFQICIFRLEINRKCSNTSCCCWLLITTWSISVHRNFHFLFWSLLFGLFGHQHVPPLLFFYPQKSRSRHVVVGMNNFLVSPFIFNSLYQVGTAVCRSCGYVTTNIWEMSGSWVGVGRSCKHPFYKFAPTQPPSDFLGPLSPYQPPKALIPYGYLRPILGISWPYLCLTYWASHIFWKLSTHSHNWFNTVAKHLLNSIVK